MRRNQAGMTMIEIIVAVAVIAILAGALTPSVLKQIEKSKVSRTMEDLGSIKAALVDYYADTGAWPYNWDPNRGTTVDHALTDVSFLFQTDGRTGWNGPYLDLGANRAGSGGRAGQTMAIDSWKRSFRCLQVGVGGTGAPRGAVILYSTGRNGVTDSDQLGLVTGQPTGDDIVIVVSRNAIG